ncbi:MAG: HYR domain-containing protein [Verrucomicrobia bacterium]|nr:HYR domain-containing protein [Verrucomicrobiota bacterium]
MFQTVYRGFRAVSAWTCHSTLHAATAAIMFCWLGAPRAVLAQAQPGKINLSSKVLFFAPDPADVTAVKRGNAESYLGAPLAGTGVTAELWFGPLGALECELKPLSLGRTTFKTGGGAGQLVDVLSLSVTGTVPGERVRLQLRAWDNQGGAITTWKQADASATLFHGSSAPFDSAPLGGPGALTVIPTPDLSGIQRFNIHRGDNRFQAPAITRQPETRTDCLGGIAFFRVEATGEAPLSFAWFKNGAPLSGETNDTLFLTPKLSDEGSTYFVDVANSVCRARSLSATLHVDPTFDFFANFNTALPANAAAFGNTHFQQGGGVASSGGMGLVSVASGLTGWFSVPPFFTAPVQQFQVNFKSLIVSRGALASDGFSFNLSPTAPNASALPPGDEGQSDGLAVVFDTFNTPGTSPPEAPAIDIKWQGKVFAHQLVSFALNRYADVGIQMTPDGSVTVSYDGSVVHDSVPIPGFKPFRAFFNLGAHAGASSFAGYNIDDLCVSARSNSLPTISSPGNPTISEDGATPALNFKVDDLETPPADLVVTASSDNPGLVPAGGVVFGGAGNARTVTVTPAANQFGQANITLTVADAHGGRQSVVFLLTVNSVNDTPTISKILDQAIDEDATLGPIAFTIGDVETAASALNLSVNSSNTVLVPISAIALGGSGSNRTVTVTPASNASGTSLIAITVSDGGIESFRTTQFLLTVRAVNDPPQMKAIQNVTIDEDASTPAIPFTVSDVDSPLASITLTATSSNVALIPVSRIVFGGVPGTPTIALSPNANQFGTSLITVTASDGGASSQQSFLLTVRPVNDPPLLSQIADQFTQEDTALGPLPFTVSDAETATDQLALSLVSSNLVLFPPGSIVLGGNGTNRTLTLRPATNQFGSSLITVKASDGSIEVAKSFVVVVGSVNDRPVIIPISGLVIFQDEVAGPISFVVQDVETPAGQLLVSVGGDNTNVLVASGIALSGASSNRSLTLTPVAGQAGIVNVTVTVTDANEATASAGFRLTVLERPCVRSTRGTNFWLTFPGNFGPDPVNAKQLTLAVAGDVETRVRVDIPGLGFQRAASIPSGGILRVPLPPEAELGLGNDQVSDLGVHVAADAAVSVTGFHEQAFSQDAFGAFPVDVLGRQYLVLAYGSVSDVGPGTTGSQFAIVGVEDGTTVQIKLSAPAASRPKGGSFSVQLNRGQTYQLRCDDLGRLDLSGTEIQSDKSIALFAGHQCAAAPVASSFFCNYLNEPVPPLTAAGTNFLLTPFLTRFGDTFRVMGVQPATRVLSNNVQVATLARGQILDMIVAAACRITASAPVMMAQVANSSFFDLVEKADPTFVILPPAERYLSDYTFFAETNGMESYLNIMSPAGARAIIRLDGSVVPLLAAQGAPFSFARVPVSPGAHRVQGNAAFGAIVYGFDLWDAYGYSAGMTLDDTRGPDVVVPASLIAQGNADCRAAVPDVPFTAFDTCGPTRSLKRTQSPLPGTLVGVGTHEIITTVSDGDGNQTRAITVLSVRDRVGIALNCPADISATSVSEQGVAVSFQVTAAGSCAPNFPVVCDPASGSVFPVGVTEVVCRLADPNLGDAVCRFHVTVTANSAPLAIDQVELRQGALAFWFETVKGVDYVVESRPDLLDAPWAFLRVIHGTGERLIVTESIPSGSGARFFRFRIAQ